MNLPSNPKIPDFEKMMTDIIMLPGGEEMLSPKRKPKPDPDFVKSERISIRIAPYDKKMLKQIAREEGMPYQTLVASILRRHITDKLKK